MASEELSSVVSEQIDGITQNRKSKSKDNDINGSSLLNGDGSDAGVEAPKSKTDDLKENKEAVAHLAREEDHESRTESKNSSPPENNEASKDFAKPKRTSRSRRSTLDTNDEAYNPVPKVLHKIEYRHVSTNAVCFVEESDRFAPTKPPREEPILEVVTVAFTAQDRSPYSHRQDVIKPPPIHSMGHTFIQINSAAVINALRNVVEYYPGQNLIGDSININAPYLILMHHQKEIEQYREIFNPSSRKEDDENDDPCQVADDTYEHLGIVLEFLAKTMKDSMEKELARHAREKPVVTYEMLWTLFKPGTNVYFDEDSAGIFDSFVVKNVSWEIHNGSPVRYNIGLWNLYYDSVYVGPRNHFAEVLPFDGEKEIASLDIFPCQYVRKDVHKETEDEMHERLVKRGKKFWALTSKQAMWHDGLTTTFPRQKFVGTVMVDAESFWSSYNDKSLNGGQKLISTASSGPPPLLSDDVGERTLGGIPTCFCKRCIALNTRKSKSKFADYARINPMVRKELTPHQYWLCDRSLWAFIMKVRQWHKLDAANFSKPRFDTHLIDDLVLASDTKNLIRNLSKNYTRRETTTSDPSKPSDPWDADFDNSRGDGVIFLLHGKPGVGKTYTAECVAAYTRRPLLSLTCTDLGTSPTHIESKLTYWFKLAKHWGSILLLDEADIYMEARTPRDLTRNNLVAGFLRAMEHYSGILFLTTNRVGTFDDAFISRIHVSVHYPEFTDDMRREVWGAFLNKLEAEKEGHMVVGECVRKYVASAKDMRVVKWNGREIRNAFQTAVALAEVGAQDEQGDKEHEGRIEKVVLKEEHVAAVVRMSAAFKKYLATLHQGDEGKRAVRDGLRVDDFEDGVEREDMAHYI